MRTFLPIITLMACDRSCDIGIVNSRVLPSTSTNTATLSTDP